MDCVPCIHDKSVLGNEIMDNRVGIAIEVASLKCHSKIESELYRYNESPSLNRTTDELCGLPSFRNSMTLVRVFALSIFGMKLLSTKGSIQGYTCVLNTSIKAPV
jgi:hypothetical protein